MPIVEKSSYQAPFGFKNCHVQTIYSSVARKLPELQRQREQVATDDGDFLDLDWVNNGSDKIVIISHGLEGNSKRSYVKGMAAALSSAGFDCVAWNFRGCSGVPNNKPYSYHSGFSQDLAVVVNHVVAKKQYRSICLVGFSVGGNITLKYLCENKAAPIISAVVYSVPLDLKESAEILAKLKNKIYMHYFITQLKEKVRAKNKIFPNDISLTGLSKIRNFREFDDRYTAPLFGYSSAEEYWSKNSSLSLLANLSVPTLLVSALDDPFLGKNCYPYELAEGSNSLFLETPSHGGHVGFISRSDTYWSEARAIHFFNSVLK